MPILLHAAVKSHQADCCKEVVSSVGPDGLDQRGEDFDDAEDREVDVAPDDAGSDALDL